MEEEEEGLTGGGMRVEDGCNAGCGECTEGVDAADVVCSFTFSDPFRPENGVIIPVRIIRSRSVSVFPPKIALAEGGAG